MKARHVLAIMLFTSVALLLAGLVSLASQARAQQAGGQAQQVAQPKPQRAYTPVDCDAWSLVTSPSPGSIYNLLYAVAGVSANDVWAVGIYSGTGTTAYQTLIEHWDGSTWAVVPSPNVGPGRNELFGVAAAAANDVWAVGHSANLGEELTLIEHWDGSNWTVVPSPAPGFASALSGVAVVSANDIWAVGSYTSGSVNQTLTEHWTGSAWAVVASPSPGSNTNLLWAVAAVATNDVWAVGYYRTSPGPNLSLVEHWDGSAWTVVPSPNVGSSRNELYGVAAASASDVWAVGYYVGASGSETLIEHWNGSAWAVVSSPNGGSPANWLWGAAVVSNDVWAVGFYQNGVGAPTQTLVERYTACPPTPTPCPITFTDVPPDNTFYSYIRCLACRNILGGYADGTFRPGNNITRGQLSKIVSIAANITDPIPSTQRTYADVPNTNTFWLWIEQLSSEGYVSGYTCGGPGEPCDAQNRPYFRWGANATRGQISKIVSNTKGYDDTIPSTQQTFTDVPHTNTFWLWIERLALHGVMSGYQCGGPGEPCDPQSRPYFRWGANATRGQTSKIVANTFIPSCVTPLRR
jgi:hypothetical protein